MSWEAQITTVGVVALAAIFGGIIGFERRAQQKSAGLRTHALIAAATALLTSLGSFLATSAYADSSLVNSDPIRILQSIMIGVSFIAGGMIFHKTDSAEKDVQNLTTAASILLTSLIGATVGLQLFVLSTALTLLTVSINAIVRQWENSYFDDGKIVR